MSLVGEAQHNASARFLDAQLSSSTRAATVYASLGDSNTNRQHLSGHDIVVTSKADSMQLRSVASSHTYTPINTSLHETTVSKRVCAVFAYISMSTIALPVILPAFRSLYACAASLKL